MALDPQASRFLERLHRLNLPPIWEIGEAAIREAQWEESAAAAFTPDPRFTAITDVVISRDLEVIDERPVVSATSAQPLVANHGQLTVRRYEPVGSNGDVCIYFHGGGWVIGSVVFFDPLVRELALASGMTFVSVEYRLSPEHPFPAATLDAELALRWVQSQVADGGKIAVAGDSAGANLAAALCLMTRDCGEPLPAAQVLFYPVTDADFERPSYLANREGYFLSRQDMQWFWSQYVAEPEERLNPYASPLQGELGGLPPARICVAGHDPLHDEGRLYAEKLVAAGVAVDFVEYPGMIHGFVKRFPEFEAGRTEIREAGQFLRRVLGER
ncbi:MAG: hypothetical protein C0478_06375 [Planctomyces sp.]|nr:hypothetical protein [Planctomyces sp.]